MKKHLLLQLSIVLLLFNTALHAQFQNGLWTGKQAYNWYFADYAGLTFSTTPPSALTDGQVADAFNELGGHLPNESSGVMSDAEGNLLFYTDARTVWNKNHQVMHNGTGLLGSYTSTSAGLIVPKPNSPNIYYIFTTGGVIDAEYGLMYTEVDMSLNGGLGGVTANKNVMLSFVTNEMISAVHHADDNKVWLVGHRGAEFMAFLVSEEGVSTAPIITEIGETYVSINRMKMSPNGKKIIVSEIDNTTTLYDFDYVTGSVLNPVPLTDMLPGFVWEFGVSRFYFALSFSPNSEYVYVGGAGGVISGIYQFQTAGTSEEIQNSITTVTESYPLNLELGPDGKLYFVDGFHTDKVCVVNYPNNKGLATGVELNTIDLLGKTVSIGFPSFIQSYLESGILHEGECANEAVTFSTIRIPGITSITWNFGDTASGANNISTDLTPSHTFATPGTYRVTAIIISNGAEQTTETNVIITAPAAVIPQVPALCADANGNVVFNLSQLSTGILNGQDPAVFSVAYFASEADVTSNSPIATPDSFTTSGRDIYAQVTNNQTGCKSTIQFNLPVNPLPVAATPADLEQCGIAGTAVFDLTLQNTEILDSLAPDTFNIAYFANAADVQANNPISNPAAFTAPAQQVYAIVTNTATGCSSSTITFNLVVTGPAIVAAPLQLEGCSPVNLTAVVPQLQANANVSFYANQIDAVTAVNALADVNAFGFTGDSAMVFVRVETSCVEVYTVNLEAGECTIPRGISPNNDGKNDSFDLSAFNVTQLSIYNRYGQQVYSRDNYVGEWHGQTDNNNELPTGTYYYSIEQTGGEHKTGWVYINREVN